MHLWIIRHGKAEPQGDTPDDWTRRLVPRGERQAAWLGQQLAEHTLKPRRLIASPVTRAAQTARLVNGSIRLELEWSAALETDRPVSAALTLIQSITKVDVLAIVGHNFQLSELCNTILGSRGPANELSTGEAALVSLDHASPRGSGSLVARLRLDD